MRIGFLSVTRLRSYRHSDTLIASVVKQSICIIALATFGCLAQPQREPSFEAASIKLSGEDSMRVPGRRIQTSPGMLTTRGLTLRACIIWAYDAPAQVVAPDWANDVRLDIVAKAASPVGDRELYHMLRTLLADRMGLKAHFEKREMPVYALTIAKGGPKFSPSATDGPLTTEQDKTAMVIRHGAIRELAAELSGKVFDRPVIDATGLNGRYDFRIDLAAIAAANPSEKSDRMDAATMMMEALRQQLGLKVESRKGMVDALVVDHVERTPSGN